LKGDLRGLVEVVEDHASGTYRAVYTAKLANAIYVLHVFQKKATRGIATPKHELDLIKARLRWAEQHAKTEVEGWAMKVTKSSGNVFADFRLPDAEERLLKAQLAAEIARIIAHRKLTQRAAAELMGIDQPKVSHLLHGRLAGFSTDRLLAWLTALGQDVEILVRAPPRRRQGRLRVRILAAR
jgi:predicted XRE-type DNA-binding protein